MAARLARGAPRRDGPEFIRICIAVDPAFSTSEDADLTGIIVAGLAANGHAYVIADLSRRATPLEWARVVAQAFRDYQADVVVSEMNLVPTVVRSTLMAVDPTLPLRGVMARRGKYLRAEPVAALYEQGRVHHVGTFPDLEDQFCTLTPDIDRSQGSPDRADAAVYAIRELIPIIDLEASKRPATETEDQRLERAALARQDAAEKTADEWVG